jgi:PAS domain S-box-containing protein
MPKAAWHAGAMHRSLSRMPHSEQATPHIETGSSTFSKVIARSAAAESATPIRIFLATLVPIIAASIFEQILWPGSGRWAVFSPAVFLCAWFGGFASGVAATVVSTVIMWWFFVTPEHVLLKPALTPYTLAVLFVLMGLLMSGLLRGLRRTAAALARNQRLLQGILDYSPSAIVVKDIESRYILVNEAFARLTNVQAKMVLQRTDSDLFPRNLAEEILARDKVVRETREAVVFEQKVDAAAGTAGRCVLVSEFPLLDDSRNLFALGAIETDISQRKHDEEALRRSMDDLRAAQHVAHVGSWRWDFRTNEATWSDELYEIFGIDPSASARPLVNPGLELLTADSVLCLSKAIEKLRADGEPYEIDLEFTRPDGAKRWCAARGEAVRAADGRIIGVSATAADITHIKELESLRQEWTSMIAHDLRQPISVISMASELIPELRGDEREGEATMVRRIQSAAQTLKRMVDDLLDMSLLEARRLKLERQWIDLCALVRETVDRLKHVTGDRVHVSETAPTASVFADPMRIEQVLGNLLSNAAKYGEPNTTIDVQVTRADAGLGIAVTNRGEGIDAKELPWLFDRFMRSKTTKGSGVSGLGLGLYISRGIIEAHGGRLWVESVPGKTTTFHISLPVTEARQEVA